MIDGAKALRRAVPDVLGEKTPVQRCIRHKERNVLDHLPERDRPVVRRRLRSAWALERHATAQERLEALAAELEPSRGDRQLERREAARTAAGGAHRRAHATSLAGSIA